MIDDLRTQMRDHTAGDTPSPDLLLRVHAGARRRSRRARAGGAALAVAAVVGAGALVATVPSGGGGGSTITPATASPSLLGPTDAELRAAQWFGVTTKAEDQAPQTVWKGRSGVSLRPVPGGGYVRGVEPEQTARFSGMSFDEVLALPADAAQLRVRILSRDTSTVLRAGALADDYVATYALDLLTTAPVTQSVRAALVELVQGLTGTVLTTSADESGPVPDRITLSRTMKGTLTVAYEIDTVSSRVVAERYVGEPAATQQRTYTAWLTRLSADAAPYAD